MRLKKCIECGKQFKGRADQARCDICLSKLKSSTIRPRTCRQCGKSNIDFSAKPALHAIWAVLIIAQSVVRNMWSREDSKSIARRVHQKL